jgi:hypothetical protein
MRRLRPTFLLRCVIGAVSLLLCGGVVLLMWSWGWTLAAVVVLIVVWFAELELELVSWLIERWLTRRAGAPDALVRSIWFVDRDAEAQRDLERFHDDTADNPTIR